MSIILLTPGFPRNSHKSQNITENTEIESQEYAGYFNEIPFQFIANIARNIFLKNCLH